jgi:hypothetical protein
VLLRRPFPGGTGAGRFFEVPNRNPYQGFRQDGIHDDRAGAGLVAINDPRPWLAQSSMRMNSATPEATITKEFRSHPIAGVELSPCCCWQGRG